MTAVSLHEASVVALHPLHIGEDRDGEAEVGRPETGVFISLPPEGVSLVRWLQEQAPLKDVSERFEATYGVEADVADFVREMSGCGFVRSVDGQALPEPADEAEVDQPRSWRLLGGLPARRVAWLLSTPARIVYAAVWIALPALLLARPDLAPSASGAFLDIGALGSLVVLTALGWLLVFLHELAHMVAVRGRDCSGSLDISHRLHIVVAQTDMTSTRILPRNERYAPYLAGMTWDAALLLACLVAQAAGAPSAIPALLAYLLAGAILFQFAFYLRTDVYYVLTNLLRLGNLMDDTRRWLANVVAGWRGRAPRHDLSDVPPRELRLIRWFAALMVVGVGVTIGEFVLLGLPLLLLFVRDAASGLDAGAGSAAFWDSVGLLSVVAAQFSLLVIGVVRERLRRRAREAGTAAGLALIEEAS